MHAALSTDEMFAQAAEQKQHPDYAGELTAAQAYTILGNIQSATLVDVRTMPEWQFAGTANLEEIQKEPIPLSWRFYPTMEENTDFVQQLSAKIQEPTTPLLFICRTGARSLDAAIAMTGAGYQRCFNITDGFEGPKDDEGRRGTVAGWKASQLPWEQA